jgi:hypothetical protein
LTREPTRFERKILVGFLLACLLGWGLFAVVVCVPATLDGRTYHYVPGMIIALFGLVWIGGLTVLACIPLFQRDASLPR